MHAWCQKHLFPVGSGGPCGGRATARRQQQGCGGCGQQERTQAAAGSVVCSSVGRYWAVQ
jgi:hypothetical protein